MTDADGCLGLPQRRQREKSHTSCIHDPQTLRCIRRTSNDVPSFDTLVFHDPDAKAGGDRTILGTCTRTP